LALPDEIQSVQGWRVWLKHQVDFEKNRRIAVTGSATPVAMEGQESGVGRWHTIKLAKLSFYEYLKLRNDPVPKLPSVSSLADLFDMTPAWFKSRFRGKDPYRFFQRIPAEERISSNRYCKQYSPGAETPPRRHSRQGAEARYYRTLLRPENHRV
jgi:predicted AAA+ superfamily ATPase